MGISLINKIILMQHGAIGLPLIIPAILWYVIIRFQKRWAVNVFMVFATIVAVLGVLGVVLLFGYLYRGIPVWPCLLMIIMGCNYSLTAVWLKRNQNANA